MGRLTEYFGMLDSDNLEEDRVSCFHIDCDKYWPEVLEGRKLLRKHRKATPEPQLFV